MRVASGKLSVPVNHCRRGIRALLLDKVTMPSHSVNGLRGIAPGQVGKLRPSTKEGFSDRSELSL